MFSCLNYDLWEIGSKLSFHQELIRNLMRDAWIYMYFLFFFFFSSHLLVSYQASSLLFSFPSKLFLSFEYHPLAHSTGMVLGKAGHTHGSGPCTTGCRRTPHCSQKAIHQHVIPGATVNKPGIWI